MFRLDIRCMPEAEDKVARMECMDCRQITEVVYSTGHSAFGPYFCDGCGGESIQPVCPCGGELVREGVL